MLYPEDNACAVVVCQLIRGRQTSSPRWGTPPNLGGELRLLSSTGFSQWNYHFRNFNSLLTSGCGLTYSKAPTAGGNLYYICLECIGKEEKNNEKWGVFFAILMV